MPVPGPSPKTESACRAKALEPSAADERIAGSGDLRPDIAAPPVQRIRPSVEEFVDALAFLAADLWFAGKLEYLRSDEGSADDA